MTGSGISELALRMSEAERHVLPNVRRPTQSHALKQTVCRGSLFQIMFLSNSAHSSSEPE